MRLQKIMAYNTFFYGSTNKLKVSIQKKAKRHVFFFGAKKEPKARCLNCTKGLQIVLAFRQKQKNSISY